MSEQRYKYPRTTHLPWSRTVSADDLVYHPRNDLSIYSQDTEVVITEKMDGENTTIYSDGVHARSIDSQGHPSRDWVRMFQGQIGHLIPSGMRLCGENLYARHSIAYHDLSSFFLLFSLWEDERCLSWDETEEWSELLEIPLVPVLYRGGWNEEVARDLCSELNLDHQEGYVVRPTCTFSRDEFSDVVYKWVRPHHVQTDDHWMYQPVVPNHLYQQLSDSGEED